MEYTKVLWDFEKQDRVPTAEETAEGDGPLRIEGGEYGPVTYGCRECAYLRAWMKSLAARAEVEETLPRPMEFVDCFKRRRKHEDTEKHVTFGWNFDAYAVRKATEWSTNPVTGAFWREFKIRHLVPRTTDNPDAPAT